VKRGVRVEWGGKKKKYGNESDKGNGELEKNGAGNQFGCIFSGLILGGKVVLGT